MRNRLHSLLGAIRGRARSADNGEPEDDTEARGAAAAASGADTTTTGADAGTTSLDPEAAGSAVDSAADHVSSVSDAGFLALARLFFPGEVGLHLEKDYPVTETAYGSLSVDEVERIQDRVLEKFGREQHEQLINWKVQSFPHYRREILRLGCSCEPELMWERVKMLPANPPSHVHSMMRNEIFAGDLYSGDMLVAALARAGLGFEPKGRYLDFGTSSGALVRNLFAYCPDAEWFGCDPVASSIDWAQSNFPFIDFSVSPQFPPLSHDQGAFDGVYAVSIWSHFSETLAIRWFREMHRIIKPGGFLVFTTHGLRSIYYYLENGMLPRQLMQEAFLGVCGDGYYFQRVWNDGGAEDPSIDTSHWGNAYFSLNWVVRNLAPDWLVGDYAPGLNQINQDIYVLVRK